MLMRAIQVGAILLVAAAASLHAQMPPPLQQTVLNGLRWYFHWMKPLPEGTDNMKCRGVRLAESAFMYCTPGKLTLELANSPRNMLNVDFIWPTSNEYPKAVNWFRELHGAQVRQNFRISLALADIARYEIDEERSKAWMEMTRAHMNFMRDAYRKRNYARVGLLFPRVSKNDPAYQVYLTVDGRVEGISEFPVIDGSVQNFTHWVYDLAHHNIPASAQSFSEDPSRWYRIVSEDEQGVTLH